MRFKQLQLHGYKSFANKTDFVFDGGVTAIIGPNGSGKSNIADGVRWVLGEQSFNLLRGKKTEDMIFSGSDQRARLGMAEVTLTLDNTDGSLPVDFSEVSVTRRAYRSGENEYLINGNRVRLKDITELLGRSGLGRRTYTVIGQGLVDQVLSLRPEERRSLFEEAAGITVQQAKRDESLRRLDETKSNLQRVQDIVQEMSPRLRHLKQAADRATQARQLQTDLRDLLRTWYGYRWHEVLRDVAQAQHAERGAIVFSERLQADLTRVETELDSLRTKQGEWRQQLGDWHRSASVLHRQAETVQRELAVNEERMRLIAEQQRETTAEVETMRQRETALVERIQQLQQELDVLNAALLTHQADVNNAEAAVATLRSDRAARQRAFDQAQTESNRLAASLQEARVQLTQLGERQASLASNQAQQQAAAELARQASLALTEKLAQLETEQTAVQAEIERLQAAQSEQAAVAEQSESERRRLSAALNDIERESARTQARFDTLTRLQNEGAGYAAGVRNVLQEISRPRSSLPAGVLGTAASLLRVPSNLEMAIEAAIGGQLQDVVVETWDVAEAAIAFLKRTDGGRATFLPLDTIRASNRISVPKTAGVVGVAADLVESDKRLSSLVEYLLGRVVITEDLPAARRVRQSLSGGPVPTLVTLDGDLVRPGGSVSGGSSARARQESSVLARERELRELPAQLDALKTRAQALEEEVRAAEQKRLSAIETQRQLRTAQTQQEQQRARLRDTQVQTQRDLDRQRQTERWHADLLSQAEQETQTLTARVAQLQERLANSQTEVATMEAAVEMARQALSSAVSDDLDQTLTDARAGLARVQAQIATQTTLLNQTQLNREQAAQSAQVKSTRTAELAAESERLAVLVVELRAQNDTLTAEIDTYQQKIDPGEAELTQLETLSVERERGADRLRQQTRSAETQLSQARLTLERRQDALSRLRRDIEHDFGLVQLETSDDVSDQPPLPLGEIVETLPVVNELPDGLDSEVTRLRQQLMRLGSINPDAPAEYEEAATRHAFLLEQISDLEKGAAALREVILELERVMDREFRRTFRAVAERFKEYFSLLFNGGSAKLTLSDDENIDDAGIEIIARPPGKRPQSLALLSGGERALTAAALIFSVLSVSPPPFCIMDEVDAALDEANVGRFREAVRRLGNDIQFIVITHNRGTVEAANTIYGVSMGTDNASQVLSLRLEDVKNNSSDV